MQTRKLFLAGLGLLVLGLSSCGNGDGRKPTYPVTGKVRFDNKPVAHATIVLHPVDANDPKAVRPRGKTGADGSLTLTTYDGHDGAPAGQYRVTVELWLSSGKEDAGPTSRLPAKYARPDTSGLTATVEARPTELPPFDLKR